MKKHRAELLIILGVLILLFPLGNNLIHTFMSNSDVSTYDSALNDENKLEFDTQYNEAKEYNKTLTYRAPKDAFSSEAFIEDEEYDRILNVENTGMMGYLEIPAISLKLPVYHNTTQNGLNKGAMHVLGSSLPIGGKSTHSVIAAHTGLNGITLFDNLDQVKEKDRFYITVLGKTLCYEVDHIAVVEPEAINEVRIIEGEDYVTLVTCTPYGINTHRLLVRGHNVPYNPNAVQEKGFSVNIITVIISILSVIVGILLAIVIYYSLRKKRRER